MKLLTSYCFINCLLLSSLALQATPYSSWDKSDLKHFLDDRHVSYKKGASSKEIDQLVKKEFERIKNPNLDRSYLGKLNDFVYEKYNYGTQKVANLVGLASENSPFTPSSNWDYLTNTAQDKSNEVSNWIFNTWSSSSLRNLLKDAKVKHSEKDSKEQLLKSVKSNYNSIAKHYKTSGKYPGSWLYSTWSTEDLQKWLKDQKLSYSASESRDKLLAKVRENAYLASVNYEDNKNSFFDSLNLANQKIFNTLGQIKDGFVKEWSDSQIKEWLEYHDIDVPAKAANSRADLEKLVESNKDSLTDDIKSWSDNASKSVSPFLSKASDYIEDAKKNVDNLINETFLINVDSWSKARLRAFLNTRDIPIPHFSTKKELIALVNKNKNVPVSFQKFKSPETSWFDNWSTENIKAWLSENKQSAEGARETLVERASEFFNVAQSNAASTKDSIVDAYQNVKDTVEGQFHHHKPKIDKAADAASNGYQAATDYAGDAADYLNEQYKDKKPKAEKAAKEAADTINYHYKDKKPKAEKAAKDAASTASDLYEAATDYAGYAADAINEQYKDKKPKAEELARQASEKAGEYAGSISSGVSDLYAITTNYLNSFDSWSDSDLAGYLKSFGFDSSSLSGYDHNGLLKLTKEHASYFINGGKPSYTWSERIVNNLKSYKYQINSHLVQYWPFNHIL